MKISPLFRWYDFWVGGYIDLKRKRLYLFPVPMLGVCVSWGKPEVREPGRVTLRVEPGQSVRNEVPEGEKVTWAERSNWPTLSQADQDEVQARAVEMLSPRVPTVEGDNTCPISRRACLTPYGCRGGGSRCRAKLREREMMPGRVPEHYTDLDLPEAPDLAVAGDTCEEQTRLFNEAANAVPSGPLAMAMIKPRPSGRVVITGGVFEDTEPSNPVAGTSWWNRDQRALMVWDGSSKWKATRLHEDVVVSELDDTPLVRRTLLVEPGMTDTERRRKPVLRFAEPLDFNPPSPETGDMFRDSDGVVRRFDGENWVTVERYKDENGRVDWRIAECEAAVPVLAPEKRGR